MLKVHELKASRRSVTSHADGVIYAVGGCLNSKQFSRDRKPFSPCRQKYLNKLRRSLKFEENIDISDAAFVPIHNDIKIRKRLRVSSRWEMFRLASGNRFFCRAVESTKRVQITKKSGVKTAFSRCDKKTSRLTCSESCPNLQQSKCCHSPLLSLLCSRVITENAFLIVTMTERATKASWFDISVA